MREAGRHGAVEDKRCGGGGRCVGWMRGHGPTRVVARRDGLAGVVRERAQKVRSPGLRKRIPGDRRRGVGAHHGAAYQRGARKRVRSRSSPAAGGRAVDPGLGAQPVVRGLHAGPEIPARHALHDAETSSGVGMAKRAVRERGCSCASSMARPLRRREGRRSGAWMRRGRAIAVGGLFDPRLRLGGSDERV
jgi:hypothetical protein